MTRDDISQMTDDQLRELTKNFVLGPDGMMASGELRKREHAAREATLAAARKAIADLALLSTPKMVKIGNAIAKYAGSDKLKGAVREANAGDTKRLREFFKDFSEKASPEAIRKIASLIVEPGRLASPAEMIARAMDDLGSK